jgi:hypothetical protein
MGTIMTIGRKEWRFTSRPWEEIYEELLWKDMSFWTLRISRMMMIKMKKLNDRALSVLSCS